MSSDPGAQDVSPLPKEVDPSLVSNPDIMPSAHNNNDRLFQPSSEDDNTSLSVLPTTTASSPPPNYLPSFPNPPNRPHAPVAPSAILCWRDLEPWMDQDYANQVCTIMGWHPTSVRVPPPEGSIPNEVKNIGCCYLTFPSMVHAGQVLNKIASLKGMTMPKSSRPFNIDFAPDQNQSLESPPPATASQASGTTENPLKRGPFSIFVGDLAPEVSNSDLLAVFQNPVLGLRSDRAPKIVQPFPSVVSAYILTDPVTHMSKGYGFVRFNDQKDQTRALIEMNGLYCLSRPMRISPANDTMSTRLANAYKNMPSSSTFTTSSPPPLLSVSAPIATGLAPSPTIQNTGINAVQELAQTIISQLVQQTSGNNPSSASSFIPPLQVPNVNEAAQAQQSHARATVNSAISPSAYHSAFLPQSDPYNTTIFAGGLTAAITEDHLRTLFTPFGDIHYVKVLVGKSCGFIQFLRKPDAQKAIDTMQGFPIGDGKRLRLSWGSGPYKAAQAVTATQASAHIQPHHPQVPIQPPSQPLQPPVTIQPSTSLPRPASLAGLTHEQAVALLAQYGYFDQQKQPLQQSPPSSLYGHVESARPPDGQLPPFVGAQPGSPPFLPQSNTNFRPSPNASAFHPSGTYSSSPPRGFSPFSPQDPKNIFSHEKHGSLPYPLTGPVSPSSGPSVGVSASRFASTTPGYALFSGPVGSEDPFIVIPERQSTPPYAGPFVSGTSSSITSSPTKPPRFTPEANSGVISRPTSMTMDSSLTFRPASLGTSSPPRGGIYPGSEEMDIVGGSIAHLKLAGDH